MRAQGVRFRWRSFASRITVRLVVSFVLLASGYSGGPAFAQVPDVVGSPPEIPLASKAAVVMDAASGRVLYAYNAHQALPPASVTKVMTMLLALEAVQEGRLSMDDMITTSQRAHSMGGTQIWLEIGEQMSLSEMLWAIAVGSANDAAVAVAEHLAGSEAAFAELMNRRAAELGALNTHFLNASGLPPSDVGFSGDHVTSAYDLAVISRHAMTLPHFMEMVSTWGPVVMRPEGSRQPELWTYNRMIRSYTGMDGIKTGFTNAAGFCLAATAERNGVRVIAVVLGAPNVDARTDDVRRLLDYGFSQLESVSVAEEGEILTQLRVRRGDPSQIDVTVAGDVRATVLRGSDESPTVEIEWANGIAAPLAQGDRVGTLVVRIGDFEVVREPLVAAESVARASFGRALLQNARRLLGGD